MEPADILQLAAAAKRGDLNPRSSREELIQFLPEAPETTLTAELQFTASPGSRGDGTSGDDQCPDCSEKFGTAMALGLRRRRMRGLVHNGLLLVTDHKRPACG